MMYIAILFYYYCIKELNCMIRDSLYKFSTPNTVTGNLLLDYILRDRVY